MVSTVPKAVIWDVADTLVTRVIPEEKFFRECLRVTGLTAAPLSPDALRLLGRKGAEDRRRWRTQDEEGEGFIDIARALLGAEASSADCDLLGCSLSLYYDVYAIIPGMLELLEELRARSVRQAVLAEWPPSMRAFLDHHLTQYFEVIVVTSEEGLLKPSADLVSRTLDRLSLSPEEALLVGDRLEHDIAPARAVGVKAIHFSHRGDFPADAMGVPQLREVIMSHFPVAGL